jgi:hypothetical protein
MSIVLDGRRIEVPGVRTVSWLDNPDVPRVPDEHTNPRSLPPQMIVAHTSWGLRAGVEPCWSEDPGGLSLAHQQRDTSRPASWDFSIGRDGTVYWQNDPATRYTWHTSNANSRSIGFEMEQELSRPGLTDCQLDAALRMARFLSAYFGIPLTTPTRDGRPDARVLPRLASGGADVYGLVGHRSQTTERGAGDPGDAIFERALASGWRGLDYFGGGDLAFWRDVQQRAGLPVTGHPDAATLARVTSRAPGASAPAPFPLGTVLALGVGAYVLARYLARK